MFDPSGVPLELAAKARGSTPLFLAVRVRTLHLDVASGNIEVGLRVFGFWKSGLDFPEGTVLRQKHGEITRELEMQLPDIHLMGKAVRTDGDEADREVKFHHLLVEHNGATYETDTMVTVFQYRTIEEIFHLEAFPFDEQRLELQVGAAAAAGLPPRRVLTRTRVAQVRLPKSNAKDAHFGLRVSALLTCGKEKIRPRKSEVASSRASTAAAGDGGDGAAGVLSDEEYGHGPLELSVNVTRLIEMQWVRLRQRHAARPCRRSATDGRSTLPPGRPSSRPSSSPAMRSRRRSRTRRSSRCGCAASMTTT